MYLIHILSIGFVLLSLYFSPFVGSLDCISSIALGSLVYNTCAKLHRVTLGEFRFRHDFMINSKNVPKYFTTFADDR